MEKKRKKCWKWKVQIADCRYRPLTQTYDNYNPRIKGQTIKDYYIHKSPRWTDGLVRQFRRNVRMQNICVRQGVSFYSRTFEKKIVGKRIQRKSNNIENIVDKIKYFESKGIDYWFPDIRRSSFNKLSR
jgi:hypothetical protein